MSVSSSSSTSSYTPSYYAAIHIVLQKKGRKDDLLTLRPDEHSNNYNVTFIQNSVNVTTESVVTPDTITNYLRLFFEAMEEDIDGPECVQIEVPTFPSVCVPVADAPYYVATMNRQIMMLQELWEEGEDWPTEPDNNLPKLEKSMHSTMMGKESPRARARANARAIRA